MSFLNVVCLAGNACILTTSMDAIIEQFPVADLDVIAYRQYIARDSCLALKCAYDQKHTLYVELAYMLLRIHG